MARLPAIAVLLSLASACGPATGEEQPPPDTFIAFLRDFQPYRTWEPFAFEGEGTNAHVAGHRTVYLNRRPPAGATAFPVGSILVKELPDGTTFAMVKRGGTYNSLGAKGWEWFELRPDTSGQLAIAWRGIAPPAGETYAGIQGGACNDCHTTAVDNDSVLSPALRLSTLGSP